MVPIPGVDQDLRATKGVLASQIIAFQPFLIPPLHTLPFKQVLDLQFVLHIPHVRKGNVMVKAMANNDPHVPLLQGYSHK